MLTLVLTTKKIEGTHIVCCRLFRNPAHYLGMHIIKEGTFNAVNTVHLPSDNYQQSPNRPLLLQLGRHPSLQALLLFITTRTRHSFNCAGCLLARPNDVTTSTFVQWRYTVLYVGVYCIFARLFLFRATAYCATGEKISRFASHRVVPVLLGAYVKGNPILSPSTGGRLFRQLCPANKPRSAGHIKSTSKFFELPSIPSP